MALDPDVLELCGQLLASADEQYAAGLCFFLSGSRRPEYEQPIALVLHRTRKRDGRSMLSLFPSAARRYGAGHLPENVRAELERRDTVTVYIIIAVLCFLALALVTGLLTIARTVFGRLPS